LFLIWHCPRIVNSRNARTGQRVCAKQKKVVFRTVWNRKPALVLTARLDGMMNAATQRFQRRGVLEIECGSPCIRNIEEWGRSPGGQFYSNKQTCPISALAINIQTDPILGYEFMSKKDRQHRVYGISWHQNDPERLP
jgi:hypothetical protein